MRARSGVWLVAAAVVAALTAPVVAAGVSEPQNKLLAMRAAQADALRKLAEQIYGLQIDAKTTVKDFVTESDVIRTQVKAFLRGAKMEGEPRWYSDGACEVDYKMTLETIVTNLKRIADGYSKSGKFTGTIIEQITQHTKLTEIRVTGSGAPRSDVEVGVEAEAEGLASGVSRTSTSRKPPLGWENVKPQGRLMAMRAAQLDAYRLLSEQIYGLQIDSETRVKDFVAESDEIRTRVSTFIKGVKFTAERYMSDQVAECDAQVALETVIQELKRIADGTVHKDKFKGDVFEKMTTTSQIKVIKVTGRGAPPADPQFYTSKVGDVVEEPPAWAGRVIKATGRGAVDQAMLKENPAQAWLMAERAAELDARRQLAEQVDGVRIDAVTLVKDFVTQHDAIKADMATFQKGARVGAKRRLDDGTAEVDVELSLERLWMIIKGVK